MTGTSREPYDMCRETGTWEAVERGADAEASGSARDRPGLISRIGRLKISDAAVINAGDGGRTYSDRNGL